MRAFLYVTFSLLVLSCENSYVKSRYSNGQEKLVETYRGDSLPDNLIMIKEYYESGKISSEIKYKNGMRNGSETTWYENGSMKYIFNYKNDSLNGEAVRFFDTGKKYMTGYYQKDNRDSIWIEYDKNGDVWWQGKFVNGYLTFKDSVVSQPIIKIKGNLDTIILGEKYLLKIKIHNFPSFMICASNSNGMILPSSDYDYNFEIQPKRVGELKIRANKCMGDNNFYTMNGFRIFYVK